MLLLVSPVEGGGWVGKGAATQDARSASRSETSPLALASTFGYWQQATQPEKVQHLHTFRLVGKLRSMLEMLGLSMSVCPYQCHIQMTTKAHTAAWRIAIFGSMEANT